MPEMRAETIREAQRKGVGATEDVTDPYDLMSMSRPTHAEGESGAPAPGEPHARSARAERLRSGPHLKRGETGGPS